MSLVMADRSPEPDQATRLLLGMTPPPPPRPPSSREREGRMIRTLLDLILSDKMADVSDQQVNQPSPRRGDHSQTRWRTLKQRLRLKSIASACCCGGSYATCPPQNNNNVGVDEQESEEMMMSATPLAPQSSSNHAGMSLGMALEAEAAETAAMREEKVAKRVELMRLMEEEEEVVVVEKEKEGWCCVCMERKKGGAMIPCGHMYCRECCRQVWLSRGSCPLCNRPILDILHLY